MAGHFAKAALAAFTGIAALALAPATAAALDVNLTNGTSRDLESFFAAAAGSGAFGDDLMGGGFLPAGNQATFSIADDGKCDFDLRFVFSAGDAVEEAGVDLCATGSYTVSD